MTQSQGYVTTEDEVRLFFQTRGSGHETIVVPNGTYLLDDFEPLASGRTLIAYDVRNRGRSDAVTDPSKLSRGIHHDIDDLEAVRRHFGVSHLDLIGHSYMGLMVILFAMKHPDRVRRIVPIGPAEPEHGKEYPAHLTGVDATSREVFARLDRLQRERGSEDPQEFCLKFWRILRLLYVTRPSDADRIDWGRCDLPNELNLMKYWTGSILPSMRSLKFTADETARVKAPILVVHGRRDRSAPYGGAREWAMLLPDARLITIDDGGHAPWIEAPEVVFGSIETFFGGAWPETAEAVRSLDPAETPSTGA